MVPFFTLRVRNPQNERITFFNVRRVTSWRVIHFSIRRSIPTYFDKRVQIHSFERPRMVYNSLQMKPQGIDIIGVLRS